MTAHTPRPWILTADPYEDGGPYFRLRAGELCEDLERMGFSISGIMREPDARLIAAAPDLLEALEGLLACPAIADGDHDNPEWGDEETAQAEKFARAALTKAKEQT